MAESLLLGFSRRFPSLLVFYVTFFMISAVEGGSAALFSLRCYERLLSDDCFALVIILLDVVNLLILALLFGKESTPRSSRFIISSSCAELLSLLLRICFSCVASLKNFSTKTRLLEEESFAGLKCHSAFSKRRFSRILNFVSNVFDLSLA